MTHIKRRVSDSFPLEPHFYNIDKVTVAFRVLSISVDSLSISGDVNVNCDTMSGRKSSSMLFLGNTFQMHWRGHRP